METLDDKLQLLLIQLIIILIFASLGGRLAKLVGQPKPVGEIVAGLVLGPSVFGFFSPNLSEMIFSDTSMLFLFSQIGLILFMFVVGSELNTSPFRAPGTRKIMLRISIVSIVVPFIIGQVVGFFMYRQLNMEENHIWTFSLLIANVFCITAVPILGIIIRENGLQNSILSSVALASAAFTDIFCWITLSFITSLAISGNATAYSVFEQCSLIIVYTLVLWFLVQPMLKRLFNYLLSDAVQFDRQIILLLLMIMIFSSAFITQQIGVFPLIGGFLIGVLVRNCEKIKQHYESQLSSILNVFFLPLFFSYSGLRTDITVLNSFSLWGWTLLLLLGAFLTKFGACYYTARWQGYSHEFSLSLGALMNTRALMALVVGNLGLDYHIINADVFAMIVIVALLSTVTTNPLLAIAKAKGCKTMLAYEHH